MGQEKINKNNFPTLAKNRIMSQVNLDALIQREDLEVYENKATPSGIQTIALSSLKNGELFRLSLRKPEFQRETCEWSPERVYNLISSFVNGDLVPSIILWQGTGNIFVIDGAHRLSALIAWIDNDYGDKGLSSSFFGSNITKSQIRIADETRKMIEKNIGSYQDIIWAGSNPERGDSNRVAIAQRLSSLPIFLQWVPGNAEKAEKSFFRINESAAPIDPTEKRLLFARKKPSGVAARAIIRSGSGHKYWQKFPPENQNKIVEISQYISDWLFNPQLETPVKTLDVPLAGKSYSAASMELILNVVNFSNGLKIVDKSHIKKTEKFPENQTTDETDGSETIKYLNNTKKIISNLTGTQSNSMGLHPAIYFYSLNGRYQITAFMAILDLITDYEKRDQLKKFTFVRKKFEEFLWKHKNLVNQATTEWGSGAKGYINLRNAFDLIIKYFLDEKQEEYILKELNDNPLYNFFKAGVRPRKPTAKKDFSSESKTEVFMREALKLALRCSICGGYLHTNSIQIDHILPKSDGGIGDSDNGQLAHPYCNSIKKDYGAEIKKWVPEANI